MEFRTHIYYMRDGMPNQEHLERGAEVIRNGGTVIFPTETVYGLGADALSETAAAKIFEAKGRPSDNPLIVHISSIDMLVYLIREPITDTTKKLIDKFWPGPLTMIFKKSAHVPDSVTAGLDTVAVRMPDHPIAFELIKKSGRPIAAPSANKSGKPSPTRGNHVICEMNGRVDVIYCGNDSRVGLESTVLDLSGEVPVILRPGGVTLEQLQEVLGEVRVDKGLTDEKETPKAPGMKYAHYAPDAPMYIIKGSTDKVAPKINELTKAAEAEGKKVGILAASSNGYLYDSDVVIGFGEGGNMEEIGTNIFHALRELDRMKLDIIYAEAVDEKGIGVAIMNRMKKAAANRIIEV